MIIKKLINQFDKVFYYYKLKKKHVHIKYSSLSNSTIFEGYNIIHDNCYINNCKIGLGTYIHSNAKLKNCIIGRWCSIAPNVKVIYGEHPTSTYVSTHPIFYSNKKIDDLNFNKELKFKEYKFIDAEEKYYCSIGNDVWICEDAKILSGVKIGNGAIVAAGSVVTKDVPPYAIVGGVPAKIIKYRFNQEIIKKLEKIKWWNKNFDWLKDKTYLFNSVDDFLEDVK